MSILCDFRPAVYDTPPASDSLNDLIAMVPLKSAANSTGGLSSSETIVCYKELAKDGSYVCLDAKASNP